MTGTNRSGAVPGRCLDELAMAGREDLDTAHVHRYDAKMDSGAADDGIDAQYVLRVR